MYVLLAAFFYIILVAVITFASYYLAQTKTENPKVATLIGFLLALFPPFGVIYLIILALKEDAGVV